MSGTAPPGSAKLLQHAMTACGFDVEVTAPSVVRRSPRVTVVIPCYNYGHYLPGCVSSALDQRGVDVDVVIVDDASPDGSGDVADRLAARDDRITVLRHEVNRGHLQTYDDGLAVATGEYVTLVSADDLLVPGALCRAVSLMEAHPNVGFVYGAIQQFSDVPPAARQRARYWLVWPGAEWLRVRARAGYNIIASPEVVMRTSVLKRIGGFRRDLPHSGDLELWMRAARVCDVGYVMGADQAYYRQHVANMHRTQFQGDTSAGDVIDLRHRLLAFEAVLGEDLLGNAPEEELCRVAQRSLSREALRRANQAYARGLTEAPIDDLVDFAVTHDRQALRRRTGRAFVRRHRVGMRPHQRHPLWVPADFSARLAHRARGVRMRRLGV